MRYHKVIIFFTLLSSLCAIAQPKEAPKTRLIRLNLDKKAYGDLKEMKIEFVTGLEDTLALAVVSEAESAVLEERGYAFDLVRQEQKKVELYKYALYGPNKKLDPVYHTYEEVLDEIDSLQTAHPQLLHVEKIGRTSQENRDIYAVKISDNADQEEDQAAILFSGSIHADELAGTEICMTLINLLLDRYETDERVTGWVNDYEIWFIPVINIDGHHVVTSNIDPRWRKNTRDTNLNGKLYEYGDGIDLNRNFDYNWAHGGSGDSSNQRYRGTYPFSESECVAVAELAKRQKFLLSITYHSQGEVIYYPWDWRGRKAPDDKVLSRIARGLGASIKTLKGDTTYIPHYGAGTVGQTYPWLYGANGTLDFVVETGKNRHIFSKNQLQNIIKNNLQGAFYMLEQMQGPGITGHVNDAITGHPLEADLYFPDIDSKDIDVRRSDAMYGRFYRILPCRAHRLIVRKEGYQPRVFENVMVNKEGWTTLNVQLMPEP